MNVHNALETLGDYLHRSQLEYLDLSFKCLCHWHHLIACAQYISLIYPVYVNVKLDLDVLAWGSKGNVAIAAVLDAQDLTGEA